MSFLFNDSWHPAGAEKSIKNIHLAQQEGENQSHKNRALNRVPLSRLLEANRNGHSTAGGHWEATLFSTGYNLDWIKSSSIFSQSWQLLFFKDTWYPQAPHNCPPCTVQLVTHLKRGMCGRGMRNGRVVLWKSVWGVRRQDCTPLSRHHARLSPSVCRSVCVTFHLVGDSRSESLTHISQFFTL